MLFVVAQNIGHEGHVHKAQRNSERNEPYPDILDLVGDPEEWTEAHETVSSESKGHPNCHD